MKEIKMEDLFEKQSKEDREKWNKGDYIKGYYLLLEMLIVDIRQLVKHIDKREKQTATAINTLLRELKKLDNVLGKQNEAVENMQRQFGFMRQRLESVLKRIEKG